MLISRKLPNYYVKCFIKRLAFITLHAPLELQLQLLRFIKTLLIRNPSARILIQGENPLVSYAEDSFDPTRDELDIKQVENTYLWELQVHFRFRLISLLNLNKIKL